MVAQGGIYARRKLARAGIVVTSDAITDNTATSLASVGGLVIDTNDGKVHSVDASGKTQELTQ